MVRIEIVFVDYQSQESGFVGRVFDNRELIYESDTLPSYEDAVFAARKNQRLYFQQCSQQKAR